MGRQAQRCRLQEEILQRQTRVMNSMTVRLPVVFEVQRGHRKHEHWSPMGPFAVPLHETIKQPGMIVRLILGRDEKSPGLLIAGRWRPARRFEKALQFLRFY